MAEHVMYSILHTSQFYLIKFYLWASTPNVQRSVIVIQWRGLL